MRGFGFGRRTRTIRSTETVGAMRRPPFALPDVEAWGACAHKDGGPARLPPAASRGRGACGSNIAIPK